MNRLKKQFIFSSVIVSMFLLAARLAAQDRDRMIAKAKEEKLFVYYSATEIRDGTAMVHAFQKKCPFVLSCQRIPRTF